MCITMLRAGRTGGEYTALRLNRQVVDQWQSRIRMECGCDVLEGCSTRVCLYFA